LNTANDHAIKSYYKKDGTFVGAYHATNPNGTVRDNYSATGNRSPSTGTQGTTQAGTSAKATSKPTSQAATRTADGKIKRSQKAKDDFKHQHPCPSTGKTSGACSGYVIDHVQALKHGGADAPGNMQWQTTQAAKAKDKWE
jgi:hypothetical protein